MDPAEKFERLIAEARATLPTEILYPETAPYLKTLRDRSLPDKERSAAIQWLRSSGYAMLAEIERECDRVRDEIVEGRLARAGGLPFDWTVHSSPCRWATPEEQREHDERSKPQPGDPPRSTSVVLQGKPIRRREEEIVASRAIGYADRPLAERAAALLYDEVNGDGEVDRPALRPDGFSQSAVDAAKAVLLAPAAKRGGR